MPRWVRHEWRWGRTGVDEREVLTFLGRGEVLIAGSALAAFLVLSWVLRGAAPGRAAEGETDADAPLAGRRDRMVFGVAFGLVLILAGAFVAIDRGIPWSLPIFAVGFGLVLTLTRINRRYRHSSPVLRRTIDVSGAFLDLSLLAGVLIVINVLAFRYGGQPLDLTREGTYSLTHGDHHAGQGAGPAVDVHDDLRPEPAGRAPAGAGRAAPGVVPVDQSRS